MKEISFKNAKIGYDNENILFDVFNFDITKGQFVSILGKTGIGKTTILRTIIGLNKLLSGEVETNGNISICFQDSRLFPHMNVYKNISYPLEIKKMKHNEIELIVNDILNKMEIINIKNRKVTDLSGGEIKRVALARALVTNPNILLLDEPTANLDYEVKTAIRELIKNIHINNNCTIVMVTHDILDALYLSDKLLILDEKRIITYVDKNNIMNDDKAIEYLNPYINELKSLLQKTTKI